MKKQLLLLLMLFLPMIAYAGIEINGIYYNLNKETRQAEVTSKRFGYFDNIVIPESVSYAEMDYSVTSIGNNAFKNSSGLTSVTIPNSVKNIGNNAFYNCGGLTPIVIPNSVTSIGDYAFFGCKGLASITIPSSMTSIGNCAFANTCLNSIVVEDGNSIYDSRDNCNAIIETLTNTLIAGSKNTIIPSSIISIGDNAFYGCDRLISIAIPNSVTSIGNSAFHGCDGLTSLNIPNSVLSIGINAFQYSGLTSVTIPNSVTTIGDGTFSCCFDLTSVEIPNGVTSIGESAFYGCLSLNSLTISNSVISISRLAFNGCNSLTSIVIPNSVTFIGEGAFSDCHSLNSIVVEDGNPNYDSRDNCNAIIETGTNTLIAGCKNTIIPTSVISIGDIAFYRCSGLGSITIPSSVTSIGNSAFKECNSLTSVTIEIEIPLSITQNTFSNRAKATLFVPKGCKAAYEIADYWNEFKEIKDIPLPTHKLIYVVDGEEYKSYDIEEGESITPEPAPIKEGYTFSGWSDIPEKMPANDLTVTGTFSVNKYKLTYMVDGAEYKSYDVEYGAAITPEPAPAKEGYSFSGWSDIPETMPANDVTITGTFSAIIVTKYTLTYKVDGEVYKTYELEEGTAITPEPTPTKEGYTFSGWSDIPETMPANDVTITGTFSINKYKLTYMVDGVEYMSYDIEYGATISPEPAPTKDGYTFSGWSDIPETMPAKDVVVSGSFSAIEIKEDTGDFTATSGSTAELSNDNNVSGEYEIPETVTHDGVTYTVTSIGNEAFKDNTNLTDVTIPSTITSIGEGAFAGCSNLKSITVNSTTPIAFPSASRTRGGSSIFEGVDKNTCILYVPEGSVELYKAAPVWSEFQNILAIGSTGINGIIHNGEPQDVYDLKGRKVKAKVTSLEGLPRGIYIINGKKIIK